MGFSQVNSTWKKWTSTRCCNRLDNKKKFHVFFVSHSGGTLLDFLQNVSRQKAIFREVFISSFVYSSFPSTLETFFPLVIIPFAAVHVAASIKDLRLKFFIMIIFERYWPTCCKKNDNNAGNDSRLLQKRVERVASCRFSKTIHIITFSAQHWSF